MQPTHEERSECPIDPPPSPHPLWSRGTTAATVGILYATPRRPKSSGVRSDRVAEIQDLSNRPLGHSTRRRPMMTDTPISDEPIYVKIRSAVDRTGVSRATLYRLAGAGLIRFVKVGRTSLIDWNSLKGYLAAQPTANIRDVGAGRSVASNHHAAS
jgi:excisionase family DNA binding protein